MVAPNWFIRERSLLATLDKASEHEATIGDAAADDAPSSAAASEAWSTWLLSGLLNACTRREEAVAVALHRLAISLSATADGTPAALAFDRLANHPWHRFTLEMRVLDRKHLPPSLCAYWALILARKPAWVAELTARKPELFRELIAKLLHTPMFAEHQLALLASLHALPHALDEQLCAEAVELLQFRLREPSAARFAQDPAANGDNDEAMGEWCVGEKASNQLAFSTVGDVVVPCALLQVTTRPDEGSDGDPMEWLRRAETLFSDSRGSVST